MSTEWNADLYLRFQKERTQPSIDLINRINHENPLSIVDIGCGPGNSTSVLKDRWCTANITGVDNSSQMIEKAQADYPEGTWILSDALSFDSQVEFDIVFSNAVLQWIPEHEVVLPHLISMLKPDGALAIQVPQNQNSPLHRSLCETAIQPEFREYTEKAIDILNYQTGHYYYNLLQDKIDDLYIWETSYFHVLESHDELLNWYKSTGLRPFLNRLPNKDLENSFIDSIGIKCKERYREEADGRILFPFNRLFILGYKK